MHMTDWRTTARREATAGQDVVKGTIAGFVGGLVGTLAMDSTEALWTAMMPAGDPAEGAEKRRRLRNTGVGRRRSGQSEPRSHHKPGPTPSERVAEMILRAAGASRATQQSLRRPMGTVVHYTFGSTVGAIYGALAERAPAVTSGAGLPYGIAVLVAADEVGLPATGIAPAPWESRAGAHAYALAGHLAYGFITEMIRRAMRGKRD